MTRIFSFGHPVRGYRLGALDLSPDVGLRGLRLTDHPRGKAPKPAGGLAGQLTNPPTTLPYREYARTAASSAHDVPTSEATFASMQPSS